MNKDFNSQLFECSFLIVSLLLKQYKENSISKVDFINHTKHKLDYIQNNLVYIDDSMQKKDIENIINECIMIGSISIP
jgi:type II restriction/modification system DNA methylase subunit YeeA